MSELLPVLAIKFWVPLAVAFGAFLLLFGRTRTRVTRAWLTLAAVLLITPICSFWLLEGEWTFGGIATVASAVIPIFVVSFVAFEVVSVVSTSVRLRYAVSIVVGAVGIVLSPLFFLAAVCGRFGDCL